MYLINNFRKFSKKLQKINEASSSSLEDYYFSFEKTQSKGGENGGGSVAIVYDDSVDGGDKQLADQFLEDLKSEGSEDNVKEMESQGAEALGYFKQAMEKRRELDSGELRKEDGWYYGKGAWRINSNKIAYLGQTPKWMTWNDDLQMDILKVYFPELLERKPQQSQSQEEPIDGEIGNDELDDLLQGTGVTRQKEFATYENKKLKHIKRIYEQSDYTLGPPVNVESEANVVTPSDLQEFIIDNYKMQHRSNMMIWGSPGIGKTQIVKDAAKAIEKELGKTIPVYIVTLAQMQPYDLNGIPLAFKKEGSPDFVMNLEERGKIHMDFAIPAWLPGEEEEESEGILFFDEINRAPLDVLAAALTLLLDRKAQKYRMPPGWRIIAAGNRAMDGPVKPFEGAVASRFLGGHFHLVPSLDDWIEWAKKQRYKDINGNIIDERYIPEEFILFLKHSEGGEGKKKDLDDSDIQKFFDLSGKPIKTEFKVLYNFDKNKLSSGGEGVPVGFPTPRNWTIAWKNIYEVLMKKEKYQSKISDDIEPENRAISTFEYILHDPKDSVKMQTMLKAVVGSSAASAFMNYSKVLKKHSDQYGTLNEKIANIFKDPSKPRPLVNIKPVKDPSERYSILGLVDATISDMGNKFNMKEFINWTKWLADIGTKIPEGELASHVSNVFTQEIAQNNVKKAAQAVAEFKQTGKNRELALAFKPFAQQFREILSKFNI